VVNADAGGFTLFGPQGPGFDTNRPGTAAIHVRVLGFAETRRHGHRLGLQVLWKEPEDHHAVAVTRQDR